MSGGKRSLRFQSPAEMPEGMRVLYEKQRSVENVVALGSHLDRDTVVRLGSQQHGATVVPKLSGKNKYGAVPTVVDGVRFDSKREAKYYEQLKLRIAAGEVHYFLRQVAFHLPGGTKLVVDFMLVEANGSIRWIDVKGRETPVFRLKKREVEHHYPVEIELA